MAINYEEQIAAMQQQMELMKQMMEKNTCFDQTMKNSFGEKMSIEALAMNKLNRKGIQLAEDVKNIMVEKAIEANIKPRVTICYSMPTSELEKYLGPILIGEDRGSQYFCFNHSQKRIFEKSKAMLDEYGIQIEYDTYMAGGTFRTRYNIRGVKYYKVLE